jgi:hypothetical protein
MGVIIFLHDKSSWLKNVCSSGLLIARRTAVPATAILTAFQQAKFKKSPGNETCR